MNGDSNNALVAIVSGLSEALGSADFQIVRLVFLSTIAAMVAIDLTRTLAWIVSTVRKTIVLNLPPLPEIWCLLGWMSREEYDHRAYPWMRALERVGYRIREAIERRPHG
jgi:hypothetical protein